MRPAAALALVLAILAAPIAVDAQPAAKVHRIGFLGAVSPSAYAIQIAALRDGLRELGYEEGRNIVIEYRWAEGKYERLRDLAAELVGLKVALIVTHGTPGSQAAMQATTTIPIVMAVVGDPVASGLVASLARPGKNVTGLSIFINELAAKRLELLKDTLPGMRRAAVLLNPDNPANPSILSEMELTANALKIELRQVGVRDPLELERAFSTMVVNRGDALVVLEDAILLANAGRAAGLATAKRIPSAGFREYAEAGGLMAYAVNVPALWRRAATLVDKVLRGAKPENLPIERATEFETVINLKTAKALGLRIPVSVLVRANHVIE